MDGPIDLHDILKVKGADELQRYLVGTGSFGAREGARQPPSGHEPEGAVA